MSQQEALTTTSDTTNTTSFPQFPHLSDEIQLSVLTYAADAPLERKPSPVSGLTHELPHVSRQFRQFASSDVCWKTAVLRQTKKEPMWRKALSCIATTNSSSSPKRRSVEDLVEAAHARTDGPYKTLYALVMNEHLRFKGPVWYRQGPVVIGLAYERVEPQSTPLGRILAREPQLIVHANRGPVERSTPAVLVRLARNELIDGKYNVTFIPLCHVWLESLWKDDNAEEDDILLAQCLKMGKCVSAEMSRLARQEIMTRIMDQVRLAFAEVVQGEFDDDVTEEMTDEEADTSDTDY